MQCDGYKRDSSNKNNNNKKKAKRHSPQVSIHRNIALDKRRMNWSSKISHSIVGVMETVGELIQLQCCDGQRKTGALVLARGYTPIWSLTHPPQQDRGRKQDEKWSLWVTIKTGRSLTNYYHKPNNFDLWKVNLIFCPMWRSSSSDVWSVAMGWTTGVRACRSGSEATEWHCHGSVTDFLVRMRKWMKPSLNSPGSCGGF